MIVVMAIIVILSTLVLANYRDGRKRYALAQSAQQLASDLRKVQNMSMNGVGITVNRAGYGVYAKEGNTSYLIYSNTNAAQNYQPSDETIEIVNLANNVKITAISTVNDKADVYYKSPDPITYFKSPGNPTIIVITLGMDDFTGTETVTVTLTGVIQVN